MLPDRAALALAARRFEDAEPEAILDWAVRTYAPRLALACSFGGPSGMVLLDMLAARGALAGMAPQATVYYLETDLLFPETHELLGRVRERYGVSPVPVRPELTLAQQAQTHGEALWERDPDACCGLRKVEPQRKFLANFDAWMTGLRRTQSAARQATPHVVWDERFALAKVNPLAGWDDKRIWAYIVAHGVPYNTLNDRGYPSVGCVPCTRSVHQGEDARAGRWDGFNKTECGLHG